MGSLQGGHNSVQELLPERRSLQAQLSLAASLVRNSPPVPQDQPWLVPPVAVLAPQVGLPAPTRLGLPGSLAELPSPLASPTSQSLRQAQRPRPLGVPPTT